MAPGQDAHARPSKPPDPGFRYHFAQKCLSLAKKVMVAPACADKNFPNISEILCGPYLDTVFFGAFFGKCLRAFKRRRLGERSKVGSR